MGDHYRQFPRRTRMNCAPSVLLIDCSSIFSASAFHHIMGNAREKYHAQEAQVLVSEEGMSAALASGEILILFPEGTRGEPERLARFNKGIAHLARRHPEVPVTPVFLHGLGKALPKGEAVLVPFFCDVFIGERLCWTGEKEAFMAELQRRITALAQEGHLPAWE